MKLLKSFFRTPMQFVDVGANIGQYTLATSQSFPSSSVIAIEPQPDLVKQLQNNCKLNDIRNVNVHQTAVSWKESTEILCFPSLLNDGQATLSNPQVQSSRTELTVQVMTLGQVLSGYDSSLPLAMKIDIEGAEVMALKGFPWGERSPAEFILFEAIEENLQRFDSTREELFSFLREKGYRFACRCRGKWRRFENAREHTVLGGASPDCVAVHVDSPTWQKAEKRFHTQ